MSWDWVAGQHQLQAGRGRWDEVGQVEHALRGLVVAVEADDIEPGVCVGELAQVRGVGVL